MLRCPSAAAADTCSNILESASSCRQGESFSKSALEQFTAMQSSSKVAISFFPYQISGPMKHCKDETFIDYLWYIDCLEEFGNQGKEFLFVGVNSKKRLPVTWDFGVLCHSHSSPSSSRVS
jgi:hypothetical protein